MKLNLDHKQYRFTLPESSAHERLDQALAKLMPDYSRTQIKDWIETGNVLVNGHAVIRGKTKVKGGEQVAIEARLKHKLASEAQAIPLSIVYEDESLIVVNKPIGLVVHPGAGNASRTLLNALLYHAPSLQLLPRAGIVHRLDKDTSGLLVVAKTQAALRSLSLQIKKRTMTREYQAIVCGSLISGGKVDAPIGRHPLQRKRMAINETGKPAVTHFRIGERFRSHTLLNLKLETGRTHQIRVHMAHLHHPIVGDTTYGGRVQLGKGMAPELIEALRHFKRQALHALALGFRHPETDEWLQCQCELPEDMQTLITLLRSDKVKASQ